MEDLWRFATVVLAAIVALIAFQQWWVNREKLRLDLFEKRHAVFKAAKTYVSKIVADAASPAIDDEFAFTADVSDAEFLFGPDVNAYLDTLQRQAANLRRHEAGHKCGGPDAGKHSKAATDVVTWFGNQLIEGHLVRVFAPYLRFQDLEDPLTRTVRWLSRRLQRRA